MKKIFYLGLVALLGSCVKADPPEPTGEIKVRFVNTVQGSNAQDMYVAGAKVPNAAPLAYGQASPYFSAVSGVTAFAFADPGTAAGGTGNAGAAGKFAIGDNLTTFYVRENKGALSAYILLDDPVTVSNMARVRFVHLNRFLQNFIYLRKGDGTVLGTGIGFTVASTYYSVAPGTTFTASATELPEPLVIDFDFKAGKNYTVWLDGTSESTLVSHPILQN